MPTAGVGYHPKGYARYDASKTASAFDLTTAPTDGVPLPDGCIFAIITAEAQAVRWRDDATVPTTTVGTPLGTNTPFEYDGDLAKIRFINSTAGAILHVNYYGV